MVTCGSKSWAEETHWGSKVEETERKRAEEDVRLRERDLRKGARESFPKCQKARTSYSLHGVRGGKVFVREDEKKTNICSKIAMIGDTERHRRQAGKKS